ncbi:MAG: DUF1269 domain-containing protein [Mycobacterium sp.]
MKDDHELIVIAAYSDLDNAQVDFDDLERSRQHGLEMRAAALVRKNAEGHPEVIEAANKHGRLGIGLGAGVGLLFGLFAPPLGLSVLVGAAAGGLLASFSEHELRSGLQHEVGEALEAGTAVIISVVYPNGRAPIENALTRAVTFKEVRLDKSTINSLDQSIAEVMDEIGHKTDGSLNHPGTTDTSS